MKDLQLTPKQEVNLNKWMSVIKERNQTGETITAICERKGLSRRNYYYWLNKIQSLALDEIKKDSDNIFVKLPSLIEEEKLTSKLESKQYSPVNIDINNNIIQINENCSQELILKLVRGLKDA